MKTADIGEDNAITSGTFAGQAMPAVGSAIFSMSPPLPLRTPGRQGDRRQLFGAALVQEDKTYGHMMGLGGS